MKRNEFIIYLFISIAFLSTGCRQSSKPHVVRMVFNQAEGKWRFSVNSESKTRLLSAKQTTNKLSSLDLKHGDLVLLGTLPDRSNVTNSGFWEWFNRYCESRRVAIYPYGVYSQSASEKIFSIPVYHWVSSFTDPLSSKDVYYFCEGRVLGKEEDGFQKMAEKISREDHKKVFILGGLYDLDRSFPPNATPFDDNRSVLDQVANKARVEVIMLNPEPGL